MWAALLAVLVSLVAAGFGLLIAGMAIATAFSASSTDAAIRRVAGQANLVPIGRVRNVPDAVIGLRDDVLWVFRERRWNRISQEEVWTLMESDEIDWYGVSEHAHYVPLGHALRAVASLSGRDPVRGRREFLELVRRHAEDDRLVFKALHHGESDLGEGIAIVIGLVLVLVVVYYFSYWR